MILPFLGFPRGLKNALFIITGSSLILLAYAFKRRKRIQRLKKNEERVQSIQEESIEDGSSTDIEESL